MQAENHSMGKNSKKVHREKAKCCPCQVCRTARTRVRANKRNETKRNERKKRKQERANMADGSPVRGHPTHIPPHHPTRLTPRTVPFGAATQLGRVYTDTKNKHVVENLMVYLRRQGVKSIVDLTYGEGNFWTQNTLDQYDFRLYDKFKHGSRVWSYDRLAQDCLEPSVVADLVVLDPPYRATGGGYTLLNSRSDYAQVAQSSFGAEHHLHPDNVRGFYEAGLKNAACFNPKFLLVKVQDQAGWCQTAEVVDRAKAHGFEYWFKAILVNKSMQATVNQSPSNTSDFLVLKKKNQTGTTAKTSNSIQLASDKKFQETAANAEKKNARTAAVAAIALARHFDSTELTIPEFVRTFRRLYNQNGFNLTEKLMEHAVENTKIALKTSRQRKLLEFFGCLEEKKNERKY